MPRREARFTVNAPPAELWKFIRDFQSLCTCIPGVERITVVDDRSAELTVKEKIGVVPLIVTLNAQIDAEDPPHRLHAVAKAEHLTMAIDVTLRATESGTELLSVFDVKGEGQLKSIVDRLFEKRATERTAQFADCLQKHFGAIASGSAAQEVRAEPRRGVVAWLLACATLVFAMVVVGGVTRLTHSGLSIVEWQPLVGALPPLSDADWQQLFVKYQSTPEFQKVNSDIDLAGFKSIFWWEYSHRLLGRGIGAVFLLPMLWFLWRGSIGRPLGWKLAGVFALGAVQGAMGWYMVKSGLVDDPRVSQFRLTAHLALALLIFAAMFWIALDLLFPRRISSPTLSGTAALALVMLIFLMALSGGFVAGIRAGKAYNSFPLMNGHWVPPEILMLEPWWMNFFYNMATVQFVHRAIAWLLALAVPLFWWQAIRGNIAPRARLACHLLLGALAAQIALGIATLLLGVPVPLGVAHQGGAVMVLAAALWVAHELRQGDR